jgi:Methyltransferase domain
MEMPYIMNERTHKKEFVPDVHYVHLLMRDFQLLSEQLLKYGIVASLGGVGLLVYLSNLIMPEEAVMVRGKEILSRLPMDKNIKGCEIGVFEGKLSRVLLENQNVSLIMVDPWTTSDDVIGLGEFHSSLTQDQQDINYANTCINVQEAGTRAKIMRMTSIEASNHVTDDELDFVFIDANHSYESCKEDIEAWFPKVKSAGLVSGHDYNDPRYPEWGVQRAVDEFAEKHGYKVELGENFTWFITK